MKMINQDDVLQASRSLHQKIFNNYQLETSRILLDYRRKINERIKTHRRDFKFSN